MNQSVLDGGESLDWMLRLTSTSRDALSVKRLERDAQHMLGVGRGEAHLHWLVIAFAKYLAGDYVACQRSIHAALRLARSNPVVLGNAATLLANWGEARQANGLAFELLAVCPASRGAQKLAATVFLKTLHLEHAFETLIASGVSRTELGGLERMIDVLGARGLHLDRRLALLEVAIACARRSNTGIVNCEVVLSDEQGFAQFVMVTTALCYDEVKDLDRAIAHAIAEQFEDMYEDVLGFSAVAATYQSDLSEIIEVRACL